jgi:hypothetical protein
LVATEEAAEVVSPSYNMMLYPNPAQNQTVVYLNYASDFRVSLFDISGKLLKEENYNGEQYLLDTEKLPKGMYIVTVFDTESGRKFSQKLVKN